MSDRVIFEYRDGTRWVDCPRDVAILMKQTTDRGGRIIEPIQSKLRPGPTVAI